MPEPPHHPKATILLVDDLPEVRHVARETLEAAGHRVLEAEGGCEALEIARREGEDLDLLLTDVAMPEMDGPTLARTLGRRRPRVHVLFFSADRAFRPPALPSGRRAPFLPKPFRPGDLLRAVDEALA